MDPAEARHIAVRSAPNDPVQREITYRTLLEVGEHVLSVREVPDGDPPWQVYDVASGNAMSFTHLFIYGGETRDDALEEARRLAGKWDWNVIEPESLEDE